VGPQLREQFTVQCIRFGPWRLQADFPYHIHLEFLGRHYECGTIHILVVATLFYAIHFHLQWLDPSPYQIVPDLVFKSAQACLISETEDQAQGWTVECAISGSRHAPKAQNCHYDIHGVQKVPTPVLKSQAQESGSDNENVQAIQRGLSALSDVLKSLL